MSIFEFCDYKTFLKAEIKLRPKGGRGQLRLLSQQLSVNSTMISQIVSGDKDFTIEQAQKVAEFLVLPKLETDYFILLVQIERAGTHALKRYFTEKLAEMKKESRKVSQRLKHDRKLTDLEKSVFYSSALYSAIHLYTSVDNGKTLEDIIEKFDISRARAQDIVQFLVASSLCTQENAIFKMGTQSTHVEKGSPFLIKHHSNWRIAAIQKSESLSDEELMFTANISLSQKDFAHLREILIKTIQSLGEKVKDSPAEEIANVNLDLFWI
jgi:uncharacterized protein (TIGR02147 family)